ncbi:unnamed protein product [Adineta steineri]|uniref:Uncharacterized protein n=1 Tax=Adineta steineri TaxID=433720 RepID=A0A815UNJ6_9BILA|nr:unnamed protein product [Adineta steineri]CAF4233701.1 unnamed protein product [Adineta steineri]
MSISNMHLYQFIREECKKAIVEKPPGRAQIAAASDTPTMATATESKITSGVVEHAKEKWMVIIVKNAFLRNSLIDDIEFKKTLQQIENERKEELKRIDDQCIKKCPKCEKNYIPSEVRQGDCQYHDGYIYNIDDRRKLSNQEARLKIQTAKLLSTSSVTGPNSKPPRLIWSCCLGVYSVDPPCVESTCGQIETLEEEANNSVEQQRIIATRKDEKARKQQRNIDDFLTNFPVTNNH